MSKALIKQMVDEALQSFDRNAWSTLRLPALVWVDSRTRAFIEVPIYLYSEFGLNPLAMPDDELRLIRYHKSRPGARGYRKSAILGVKATAPKVGNTIQLKLPEASQVFVERKGERVKISTVSFVVPRHVSSARVAYFLWNCCDNSKLPHHFQFNRSEMNFYSLPIYEGRYFKKSLSAWEMTLEDLGVISWVNKRIEA